MANNIIRRTWKQGGMVNIEDLRGSAFQAEDGGHTFLISGVDENGDALALSGTPAGVLLRADGQDVTLTCSVSDGVVSATLPANAYVVPGRIGITIFLTNGGQKTAIYAAIAAVATTSSGIVAPPAGSDVVDLVNAIATAVATIPASYTDLMAAVAPTYSTSALYAVGSYAWYSGKLYRCTTAITSGETWTSAHWTQANLGSDVSDLKSALNARNNGVIIYQDLSPALTEGFYATQDVANGPIYIRESSTRGYCCIPVIGGKKYAFNMDISANFSWWAYKSAYTNGTGISKVSVDSNHIATAPNNADLLYVTVNNGTASTDLIVFEADFSIYGKTSADIPMVTIPHLMEEAKYELHNVDVSTIYDSELSFTWDANNNALVISSNWAGNNLFIVTSNEGKKTLTVTELGTKSWSVPHNGYLVYLYDSDTFAIKTSIDDLTVSYVILAHVTDNGQGTGGNLQVSGNWEKYWIKQGLNNRIDDINSTLSFSGALEDLPNYYYTSDYFPNKLQSVCDGMDFKNGICFAFITDTHFQTNSLQSKKMLYQIMKKTQVPFVVFGGDAPRLIGDLDGLNADIEVLQSYVDAIGKNNWYAVRGNHDLYDRTDAPVESRVYYSKTEGQVYNTLMKSFESRMANGDPSHMCYYVDIPAQKTRIIVLNTTDPQTSPVLGGGAVSEGQAAWLVEAINSVENTNIIVITHIPTDLTLAGAEATNVKYIRWILSAFANGTDVQSEIGGVQYTFTGTTNKMICSISGHNHKDQWGYNSGYLNIVTTCDARYQDDGHGATEGTITEQAFDVYFIDYENKTVKTVRFGRGDNRAWNYENGTVIT